MKQGLAAAATGRKARASTRKNLDRLLMKAAALIAQKGYEATSMRDLSTATNQSLAGLYHYFASKEDIFFGIVEQAIQESLAIARESISAPGSVREKLMLYAQRLIHYVKDNGELLHAIYHELHRSDNPANVAKLREAMDRARSAWEVLAEPLKKGIEDRTLRRCDPMQLVVLFDGMLRGYCFHRFAMERMRSDTDFTAAAEFITSVFLDGIVERKRKG